MYTQYVHSSDTTAITTLSAGGCARRLRVLPNCFRTNQLVAARFVKYAVDFPFATAVRRLRDARTRAHTANNSQEIRHTETRAFACIVCRRGGTEELACSLEQYANVCANVRVVEVARSVFVQTGRRAAALNLSRIGCAKYVVDAHFIAASRCAVQDVVCVARDCRRN